MNDRKIIIIGAGIAGLTSAILLTQQGYDVTLFETAKNKEEIIRRPRAGLLTDESLETLASIGIKIEPPVRRVRELVFTEVKEEATLMDVNGQGVFASISRRWSRNFFRKRNRQMKKLRIDVNNLMINVNNY